MPSIVPSALHLAGRFCYHRKLRDQLNSQYLIPNLVRRGHSSHGASSISVAKKMREANVAGGRSCWLVGKQLSNDSLSTAHIIGAKSSRVAPRRD